MLIDDVAPSLIGNCLWLLGFSSAINSVKMQIELCAKRVAYTSLHFSNSLNRKIVIISHIFNWFMGFSKKRRKKNDSHLSMHIFVFDRVIYDVLTCLMICIDWLNIDISSSFFYSNFLLANLFFYCRCIIFVIWNIISSICLLFIFAS